MTIEEAKKELGPPLVIPRFMVESMLDQLEDFRTMWINEAPITKEWHDLDDMINTWRLLLAAADKAKR